MKIAITASQPELTSPVDERFGRAVCLVVYDTDTGEHTVVDNAPNLNAAQGAGLQSARAVVEAGAQAVLTGHVGPKAYSALTAGGVTVYTGVAGTVAEAIESFRAGRLKPSDSADVDGHWM